MTDLLDSFLPRQEEAVLDGSTLTPKAAAMSKLDFTNTYLKPLIEEILQLAHLKGIPGHMAFDTDEGYIEAGSGIAHSLMLLAGSGILTNEVQDLIAESEGFKGFFTFVMAAGVHKHLPEVSLEEFMQKFEIDTDEEKEV